MIIPQRLLSGTLFEQTATSALTHNKTLIHLLPSTLLKCHKTGITKDTSPSVKVKRVIAKAAWLVLQSRKSQCGEWAMLCAAATSCSVVLHFTGYCQQICKHASCFHNASCFVVLFWVKKLISLPLSEWISAWMFANLAFISCLKFSATNYCL